MNYSIAGASVVPAGAAALGEGRRGFQKSRSNSLVMKCLTTGIIVILSALHKTKAKKI